MAYRFRAKVRNNIENVNCRMNNFILFKVLVNVEGLLVEEGIYGRVDLSA